MPGHPTAPNFMENMQIIIGIVFASGATICCLLIIAAGLMRCPACGKWHESKEAELDCIRKIYSQQTKIKPKKDQSK
jgi:hypothetical protein